MELYQAIRTRRTIREFSDEPVEQDKLTQVLEAGLLAPANAHMRDWNFVLVRDEKIRAAVVEIEGKKGSEHYSTGEIRQRFSYMPEIAQKVYVYAIPLQRRMLLTAPELLVVCYRMPKPLAECRILYDLNYLASAWCCIENILLAMASEGLFGVTYVPQHNARLRELLAIPAGYEIAAIIPLGYPAPNAVRLEQDRATLEGRVHIDRFEPEIQPPQD